MSIRIALDNRPEFYTNLDIVSGRIILGLNRPEQVGSIVVKLEGESVTALESNHQFERSAPGFYNAVGSGQHGGLTTENHKILYKIQQVFPDEYHASSSSPYGSYPLLQGEHVFPFKFRMPINNACSDSVAMSQFASLGGPPGLGSGTGLFGIGGVRFMDGSKQLFLRHVTRTLPPSLTGFPMAAEVRYYIKVTVQRPGFLKENWRYQIGFKFLPLEPPRPKRTGQEAFAQRPFTFRPKSPVTPDKKRALFGKFSEKGKKPPVLTSDEESSLPPSIEMSARLPYPMVLTCNQPVPLRLVARRINDNMDPVYLVAFQMDLIGITEVRCHNLVDKRISRWIIAQKSDLMVPLNPAEDGISEMVIPDSLWKNVPLPNTVAPSFNSCNLSRRYEVDIKLGLCWGKPKSFPQPPTVYLPLHFAKLEVFSGVVPPAALVEASLNSRARPRPSSASAAAGTPQLPPRRASAANGTVQRPVQRPIQDPLYPPQLVPGQAEAPYDDAPPSYDEAVADGVPQEGLQPRPAYSGVTNENAPSDFPREKS